MKPQHSTVADSPDQLFDLDSLLDDEEKAVRSTVRQSVGERVKPYVADRYQTGQLPAGELARQFGELGLLESVLTYEGTSEMHALVIGQALTGQQAFR